MRAEQPCPPKCLSAAVDVLERVAVVGRDAVDVTEQRKTPTNKKKQTPATTPAGKEKKPTDKKKRNASKKKQEAKKQHAGRASFKRCMKVAPPKGDDPKWDCPRQGPDGSYLIPESMPVAAHPQNNKRGTANYTIHGMDSDGNRNGACVQVLLKTQTFYLISAAAGNPVAIVPIRDQTGDKGAEVKPSIPWREFNSIEAAWQFVDNTLWFTGY